MKKRRKGLSSFETPEKLSYLLYNTVILEYNYKKGTFRLNSGGWRTNHTKNCINDNLPEGYHLYQKDFNWYVTTPEGTLNFEDKMEIKNVQED